MNRQIICPQDESPKKLENFLKKRFPIGYVRKLFRKDGVRVNGRRAQAEDLVQPGDQIQLYIPFEKKIKPSAPPSLPQVRLPVLFEDEQLVVIDKPAGIAVHEGKDVLKRHSVLGILEAKYRTEGIRPKLVHRLDRDTSGVLLIAKSQETAAKLRELFEQNQVQKEYLCLVAGRLPRKRGTIDFPLPGREDRPVTAITRFRVEKAFSETTLVRAWIETGRMHQIRLHFAQLGHPVVLDDQHGDFAFNKRYRKTYGIKRQFLHAARLTLEHKGAQQTWTAPLPPDLSRALAAVSAEAPNHERKI